MGWIAIGGPKGLAWRRARPRMTGHPEPRHPHGPAMNVEPIYEMDGEECCDEELALSILLREGVLFANEFGYINPSTGRSSGSTVTLFVKCSDVFTWGCADAEDLPYSQIGLLYKAWKSGPWGVTKWVCKKRWVQPQSPIRRDMKKDGVWDDEMEALSKNPDDGG